MLDVHRNQKHVFYGIMTWFAFEGFYRCVHQQCCKKHGVCCIELCVVMMCVIMREVYS